MEKTIDGMKINYISQGEGDLVVLLHGWGSNITLFDGIISLLCGNYHVVAPDFPGFGLSDEPKEAWDVDRYTDFAIKFINEFSPKNVILLGHSFGGRVIIKMMSRTGLPFTVSKIILTDSAGIKPKTSLTSKAGLYAYKLGKNLFSIPFIKKLAPNAVENMRKKRGSADYNSASPVMRQCLVKVVNEDLTPLLRNIKVPVLLIWGENDADTPVSDAKLMEQLIPDAGLVTLKNAGHYAFLEQAFTFNKVISSFLNIDV